MQQRQPRLGDILDDYCPRERRLTNHVVVAMIGDAVKQTRCTTCEADHEYKHATVPRQRKKSEQTALYTQVLAAATPKKVAPVPAAPETIEEETEPAQAPTFVAPEPVPGAGDATAFDDLFDMPDDEVDGNTAEPAEEGPAHRRLIRAQLPRHEGQVATTRQAPDFTIRQPNPGRPKRFGGRPVRGGAPFHGKGPGGAGSPNGNTRGGGGQRHGGRPPQGGGTRPGGNRPGGRNKQR
jgi:hypothetical protein